MKSASGPYRWMFAARTLVVTRSTAMGMCDVEMTAMNPSSGIPGVRDNFRENNASVRNVTTGFREGGVGVQTASACGYCEFGLGAKG